MTNIDIFPFDDRVSPEALQHLMHERSLEQLASLGNGTGLAHLLQTSPKDGMLCTGETIEGRAGVYGSNVVPSIPPKSLLQLAWEALHDRTLIMLMIAAVVSLSISLYTEYNNGENEPSSYEWLEGVAILVAVLIVVSVSSLNDYVKDRHFRTLNAKKENRIVKVVRNGSELPISIFDLVVGDVVMVEPGDIIPADGILVESFSLACDESGATGESDAIKKSHICSSSKNGDRKDANGDHQSGIPSDPFMLSGTTVIEGVGRMLVVAVGVNSFHGSIMKSLQGPKSPTPLQSQLNALAERIALIGFVIALCLLVILLTKWTVIRLAIDTDKGPLSVMEVVSVLTTIFIQAVTILVVAVPEGLPMAVTLALAFAATRMISDNNLVRVISACETMGCATTICSDKTGTLTTNMMTVVGGSISASNPFGILYESEKNDSDGERRDCSARSSGSFSLDSFSPPLSSLILDSLTLNSTASLGSPSIGSKTELALMRFAQQLGLSDPNGWKNCHKILFMLPFSSERKFMATVVEKKDGPLLLLVKGAPEIIMTKCKTIIINNKKESDDVHVGFEDCSPMDNRASIQIQSEIWKLSQMGLRTLALAYEYMSRENFDRRFQNQDVKSDIFYRGGELTWLGVVGIEDPLRADVPSAVATCQRAGIFIRMVTGDNLETASSIARRAGILMRGGLAMEGPRFRSLDDATLTKIIPRLQVLARSSPLDKQILVKRLKEMGEVVAVTGDGTNDGPALKAADVGFSMGITGTEVAKEASSIILMDDRFSSIVKAVGWGRCVGDAVRKFLQFQLTVNVSAVIVAVVSAIFDKENVGALTAIQLLWVNLLMDTLAALALATDTPDQALLDRPPEGLHRQLVTSHMWTRIVGQAAFQVAILLTILYGNWSFLVDGNGDKVLLRTFVFNTFVMLQLFNELLCRKLPKRTVNVVQRLRAHIDQRRRGHSDVENGFGSSVESTTSATTSLVAISPLNGLFRNKLFIMVMLTSLLGQFLIVTFGGAAFGARPLSLGQWMVSIGIGMLCLPLAYIINCLPGLNIGKLLPERSISPIPHASMTRERLHWQAAITDVRHGLSVFAALRRYRQQG